MMSTPQPETAQPDLREYLRVLRARKWEIALVTLLVIGATMFFTLRQTPQYSAQSEVLVNAIADPLNPLGPSQAPNLQTEQQLVESQVVAQRVRAATHSAATTTDLLSHLQVSVVSTTEILQIVYTDPSPQVAAKMSNAFAQAYVAFRTNQLLARLQAAQAVVKGQVAQMEGQIAKLNAKIQRTTDPSTLGTLQTSVDSDIAQLASLKQQEAQLQPTAGANLSSGQVVQQAAPPPSPSSPSKKKNGALALVAGLALGVGFAFLRERLDDRVKTREELERRLGAPVIAAIPRVAAWRKTEEPFLVTAADPKSPIAEAYRTLATNIQYMASQRPLKALMITSASSGEGKTVTAANLAVVLARAGKRVALVSFDLRRPRLHRFFGLPNDQGLSDVLNGKLDIRAAARDPGVPNLRLFPGGPVPSNSAELLGSAGNAGLMESLRAVTDFIVVDTPPVLAVADASILAPLVDGTIYVMDASHTSRTSIDHARGQLENAGAHILGVVFNNFDPHRAASYPYYAYYQHYYGPVAENGSGPSGNGKAKPKEARKARRGERKAARTAGFAADAPEPKP